MHVCIPPLKCAHTHIIHRYTSYINKEEQCKDLYAEGSQTVLWFRHQWPFTQTIASPWISMKGHGAQGEPSSRGGELPRLLTHEPRVKANLSAGTAKSGSLHHCLTHNPPRIGMDQAPKPSGQPGGSNFIFLVCVDTGVQRYNSHVEARGQYQLSSSVTPELICWDRVSYWT